MRFCLIVRWLTLGELRQIQAAGEQPWLTSRGMQHLINHLVQMLQVRVTGGAAREPSPPCPQSRRQYACTCSESLICCAFQYESIYVFGPSLIVRQGSLAAFAESGFFLLDSFMRGTRCHDLVYPIVYARAESGIRLTQYALECFKIALDMVCRNVHERLLGIVQINLYYFLDTRMTKTHRQTNKQIRQTILP